MKRLAILALGLAAMTGVFASCKSDEPAAQSPPPPLTLEESAQVKVTAKVKDIDYSSRQITLQDAKGHVMWVTAGPQIQRLNEVKVGDDVTIDYVVTLLAELRPPTAEESANPISSSESMHRSPQGSDPSGKMTRDVRVVATVEAVDLPNMRVTLKGPLGDTTTVRARKAENIKKLHVGDTIVLTYTEGLAVSLKKN